MGELPATEGTVIPVDSIVYGFRLMGYLLAVNVIGGLFVLVGQELDNVLGVLVALVGAPSRSPGS